MITDSKRIACLVESDRMTLASSTFVHKYTRSSLLYKQSKIAKNLGPALTFLYCQVCKTQRTGWVDINHLWVWSMKLASNAVQVKYIFCILKNISEEKNCAKGIQKRNFMYWKKDCLESRISKNWNYMICTIT